MFQVRFHGRGGQGVVTAAELLATAAFCEDRYAQAFPSFGSERMGAPVMSFCRISDQPIRTREPVTEPDALVIQDVTLLSQAHFHHGDVRETDLFAGLAADGYVLVNSARSLDGLGLDELATGSSRGRLVAVPASALAVTHIGRPLPGAPMLGGLAAMTGVVGLDAVLAAIADRFTGTVAEGNARAARAAFDFVTSERKAMTDA